MTPVRTPLALIAGVALGHALLLWVAQRNAPPPPAAAPLSWPVRLLDAPPLLPAQALAATQTMARHTLAAHPVAAHPVAARTNPAQGQPATPLQLSAAQPLGSAATQASATASSLTSARPTAPAPAPAPALPGLRPAPPQGPGLGSANSAEHPGASALLTPPRSVTPPAHAAQTPAGSGPERPPSPGAPPAYAPSEPPAYAPSEPPDPNAAYLNNPPPPYPLLSRRLGEQGTVLLTVWVDAQGAATEVRLARSSGHPRLDAAALQAVRGWRFVPGRRHQIAQPMWVNVPLVFRLDAG